MTDVKLWLSNSNTWNYLCVKKSLGSFKNIVYKMYLQIIYIFNIYINRKYSFVNLWFNMRINKVWHCVACRGFHAIKSTKSNQTWEHFEASKKPHPLTEIWQNQPFHQYLAKSNQELLKKNKNPCPKTHVEDKTNLTFFGIKWPTEVDMPLSKTQTHKPDLALNNLQ